MLGASYTLWMYKRVVWGAVQRENIAQFSDLRLNETIAFVLLAIAVLILGIWPAPLLDMMQGSTQHLLQQMKSSKL